MKRTRRSNFKTSKKIRLDKDEPLEGVKKTEERVQLKKLYAKLIAKDISEKPKLVAKCLAVIGDDLQGAARRHDTCRVIQMCLKHGNEEQQSLILEEMQGIFRDLACSKYSIHLAAKVFKLSGDKETLAFSLIPDARKIITQVEGSKFIQVLYETKYRQGLLKSLFAGTDSAIQSLHLRDYLDPEGTVLDAVGRVVQKCLGKQLQNLNVVQVLVLEYLECLSDAGAKLELLGRLQGDLIQLMDNRAGVRISILALSSSDNKTRKSILKTVKGHLSQLCQGEYSFLFVIKLLSVIDDTKRIGSLISSEISQDLVAITSINQGVKVLDSLLFQDWKKRISQSEWEMLLEDLNQVSKKDAEQRRKEVLGYVLPRLADIVKEKIREFVVDANRSSLVLGFAEAVISGLWTDNRFVSDFSNLSKSVEMMNNPVAERVLKKVVELEAEQASSLFSERIIEALRAAAKEKILKTRGIWVLVALAEKSIVKEEMKGLFTNAELKGLDAGQKGEQALLAALTDSH